MNLILVLLITLFTAQAHAGPATIFNGNMVKTLKSNLNLFDQARLLTGTADPTSVAQDAPQGSVYLRTGGSGGTVYVKQDAGSTTNWTALGASSGSGTTVTTLAPVRMSLPGGVTRWGNINGFHRFNTSAGLVAVDVALGNCGSTGNVDFHVNRNGVSIFGGTLAVSAGSTCTVRATVSPSVVFSSGQAMSFDIIRTTGSGEDFTAEMILQ